MNCDTVEDWLLDYLEASLDPEDSDRVRAHVEKCSSCSRALRDTRELLDAMDVARRRQEQVFKNGTRADFSDNGDDKPVIEKGRLLGDFEIIDELGRGGMGVVYKARQISLNRIVALKVLPGTICLNESAINRFRHEAQAAAKLHHTNIVPVYAQGECEGHFYYAMELIEGPNLGHLLKDERTEVLQGLNAAQKTGSNSSIIQKESAVFNRGDLTSVRSRTNFRRIARLIAEVADGLDHAHRLSVIHRDIKPQNLLLGRDGQLHITDFGLARMLDEPNLTVTGEMLGTPSYMSPEQIDADREKIDHKTDIYSLGVTLYELLTGKRPFEGVSREQIIARIRDREPKPPRKIDPHVPVDLETICLRAMEKAPHRRYPTAGEFAADLRRYADNKPILSRRTGPIEKAIKWVKRHPAKFTIGVLTVMLIAGGIVWSVEATTNRRQRAGDILNGAHQMLTREDYRRGKEARETLAGVNPEDMDPAAYERTLGLSYVLENAEDAEVHLRRSVDIDPDNLETLYLLAWVTRRLGRDAESDKWIRDGDERLESLLKENPREITPEAYFLRGTALVRTQPEKADESYELAQSLALSQGGKFYQAVLHQGRAANHEMYHHRDTDNFAQIRDKLNAASVMSGEDPYPRYLLSLAYRIAAEINASRSVADKAIEYFDISLAKANEACDVSVDSPRGFAAEAEFWESVSDRFELLKGLFEKQGVAPKPWHVTPIRGLQNAIARRSAGLERCESKRDRIEFLEYRLLDYFWLGQLDAAEADLAALDRQVSASESRKAWTSKLIPALLRAEVEGPDEAMDLALSLRNDSPISYRTVTGIACALHLLGRADEARAVLSEKRDNIESPYDIHTDASSAWWDAAMRILEDPEFDLATDWPDFKDAPKLHRAAPLFFAGCVDLGDGKRGAARDFLVASEACFDYEDYGYLARMIRRRLDNDPSWPPWILPESP